MRKQAWGGKGRRTQNQAPCAADGVVVPLRLTSPKSVPSNRRLFTEGCLDSVLVGSSALWENERYEGSMADGKRGGTRDNGIGGGNAGADLATGGTSGRHSDHPGGRSARCEEDLSGYIGWTRVLFGG